MKPLSKSFIAVLIAGAGVLVFLLYSSSNTIKQSRAVDNPDTIRIKGYLTNWAKGEFVSIENSPTFARKVNEAIEGIDLQTLSAAQKNKLMEGFYNLLQAYSNRDAEYFHKYRFALGSGASVVVNPGQLKNIERVLPSAKDVEKAVRKSKNLHDLGAVKEYSSGDPEFLIEKYRELLMTASDNPKNGAMKCTDCWKGVNFSVLSAEVFASQAEPITGTWRMEREPNIGVYKPENLVTFKPSPADLISANGSVQCVYVKFMVKTSGLVSAYPASAIWYWSPAQEAWLPHELLLGCQLNSTSILF